ncbi:hypothetical protein CDL15_Pgr007408 [Punica granatum]|uniref:RIN4 pathogenic type III effector avirulence factor Avr cleavage site domain-containing protein n=1 Tax=Punica granatum TaxID=22663 RepID=A0A218X9I3_PUNGR|nr:hypothetical protein CDL15_Pgr007408 [Punica granatum]
MEQFYRLSSGGLCWKLRKPAPNGRKFVGAMEWGGSYYRKRVSHFQNLVEWDVNDPASAEGFTVIFNKASDEKKTGGTTESPGKADTPSPSSIQWIQANHQVRNGFAACKTQQQKLEEVYSSSFKGSSFICTFIVQLAPLLS